VRRSERHDFLRQLTLGVRHLLSCPRGTALVGYTSLILLFAMAAVTVLGHLSAGPAQMRDGKAISTD